jgi:hypothetical protein
MYEFMASPAQHRQAPRQLGFIELTANPAFSVPGSWNQMMPRQFRTGPFAEFADALTHQY